MSSDQRFCHRSRRPPVSYLTWTVSACRHHRRTSNPPLSRRVPSHAPFTVTRSQQRGYSVRLRRVPADRLSAVSSLIAARSSDLGLSGSTRATTRSAHIDGCCVVPSRRLCLPGDRLRIGRNVEADTCESSKHVHGYGREQRVGWDAHSHHVPRTYPGCS